MKMSNWMLLFIFIGSISFDCFAQTTDQSIAQLNQQMKSFKGRLRVYSKCLRRKGNTEECRIATQAALKDGIRLVVAVAVVGGVILTLRHFPMVSLFRKVDTEDNIKFDREKIKGFEGYWATSHDKKTDMYGGKYPFPVANENPWPGQEEFLAKLEQIEGQASHSGSRIKITTYKGLASSRFVEEDMVGDSEYFDKRARVGWTNGFGWYYVRKFNVKPSREFYRYVMNF